MTKTALIASTKTGADNCGGEHASRALSVDQAQEYILDHCAPVSGIESLALRTALERVLAEDVLSPVNVPAHTNSAMDGYALRAADLSEQGITKLRLVGITLAGHPFEGQIHHGECVRVMTGSPMPEGCDTVVMQEHVEAQANAIRIGSNPARGENVRLAGEDLEQGAVALERGTRIHPPSLGLLASVGRAEVSVYRRPRVAFFSTGDELRSVGQLLEPGQIYDSNRYTLYGMLTRMGVDVMDMGVVRDDRRSIERAFSEAAATADAVITSGGVSVGDADFVKETLQKLGEVGFWQIAMKPGRPLAFGHINDAVFFGLPGNPVSVMVTFYQFVAPALRKLMGEKNIQVTPFIRVPCVTPLRKRPGRTEYQRAMLETNDNGELVVSTTGSQGSGVLHSMNQANCFVVLDRDSGNIDAGTWVNVQPFFGIM
ncbi:MAG: bifunctional molybdopterin-guanine dinucleotide biosynthesis adaptor protein MobB/molybdopterin molybdotransferase MoeA [Acidiferrobacterales bacterium]|nr:bifunctional molybdopterin-guanine dinucleotide biosynthesis adaptor protein MobB/molybdopterin molybdotransferase MoeA [Acidiferrobacterales bacterium]